MDNAVYVTLIDAETAEEIEAVPGFEATVLPRTGELIHFWQDGFPDRAGADSRIRIDFEVMQVEHDWRLMVAGRVRMVHSVMLHVRARSTIAQGGGDGG